jgi:hypothetical protein
MEIGWQLQAGTTLPLEATSQIGFAMEAETDTKTFSLAFPTT